MKLGRVLTALLFYFCAYLFPIFFSSAAMAEDFYEFNGQTYYEFLDVGASCSEAELKTAYHKAMMRHHPDRGGRKEAAAFANQAYAVLDNNVQRAAYDRYLYTRRTGEILRAPPAPVKTEAELRREVLDLLVRDVTEMGQQELAKDPKLTDDRLAGLAYYVMEFWERWFPDRKIHARELHALMTELVLDDRRRALGLGVIFHLKEIAASGDPAEKVAANAGLNDIGAKLAFRIETEPDPAKSLFYDRIHRYLAGYSLLRQTSASRSTPAGGDGVDACEAALRYRQTAASTEPPPAHKLDLHIKF